MDSAGDVELPGGGIDPRRAVDAVGPYASFEKDGGKWCTTHNNQIGLRHLLESSRWNPSWEEVRMAAGGDLDEEWKQDLWWAVVMCQGLEGMRMIRPGDLAPWREHLASWRAKIERSTDKPERIMEGGVHFPGYQRWLVHKRVFTSFKRPYMRTDEDGHLTGNLHLGRKGL
ncbi:hypothetical protein C8Q72DRAFT_536897 [Fomitopsis betulina]|nr:hypothetical protein C8Q72DRAFT_536897 [Fomitopsis betulina]